MAERLGGDGLSSSDAHTVLEASAVVAHRVSKDTAKQEVRRVAFRVTLRQMLIFLVLLASLAGVIMYFENQHSSDQQQLKDRRNINNARINDLQNQINDLQRLIQELRAGLLKAGVNPKDIPTLPPVALPGALPSASHTNGVGPVPSVTGSGQGSHPSPVADQSSPRPSAGGTPSSSPSGSPSPTPSSLVSAGPIVVPVLSLTIPPIRIPVP